MLPPIGIGTNRYGVGTSEEERAPLRDTMARFVELGGKVMDTAMIYGTSEAVIGDLAQELNIRDRLFLATKTDIRGQLRGEAGLQQALTRMKTDMIDAMLVHNLVNAETELPIMREWQQQGPSQIPLHRRLDLDAQSVRPDGAASCATTTSRSCSSTTRSAIGSRRSGCCRRPRTAASPS